MFRRDFCLLVVIVSALAAQALAQGERNRYEDPSLPPEVRAADLVHRMTVEEKVTQLVNNSLAMPRLKVPA